MLHRALRLLRTYHQFKQTELATRLSISSSYLSEIEKGIKAPNIELLEKYAEVFKLPVSSILLFSESMSDRHKLSERVRSVATDKILRLLEWIEEREAVE